MVTEDMKLVALAVSLIVLSALFALLERTAASVPRRSIFRRERLTDFLWWFFTNSPGLFPWIDIVFGTFYMPRDRHPESFGLSGETMLASMLGQLAYPFRRIR
jgi:hypothetical protein